MRQKYKKGKFNAYIFLLYLHINIIPKKYKKNIWNKISLMYCTIIELPKYMCDGAFITETEKEKNCVIFVGVIWQGKEEKIYFIIIQCT